jgi:hypothetical protein
MMQKKLEIFIPDIGVLCMHYNVIRIFRKTFYQLAIGPYEYGPKKCETIVSCGQSNLINIFKASILFFSRPSIHALTDGQWSPTRSAVFFTTKMDGERKIDLNNERISDFV